MADMFGNKAHGDNAASCMNELSRVLVDTSSASAPDCSSRWMRA